MSYYDDSSLFVAPNGYKASVLFAQKPMDANGQLAFTRSNDTATRVDENGLIEKVRTNLVTYSQNFANAAWSKSAGTTLTHSQTDPDGGTTATRVVMTSGVNNFFTQAISGSGTRFITLSVWVKGVTTGGTLSLNTGTAASRTGTTITYTTTWTRYEIIQNETTSNTGFQIDNYSNSVGQVAGDFLIAFAQVESSDFGATPYIATTTAARSVGPVANIPRIDYLGGGCGKLLLEPQRTNYQLYSENSAQWSTPADGLTVVYNTSETIDPSGYYGAEKVTSASGNKRMFNGITNPSGALTMSAFVKKGTGDDFLLRTTSLSINVQYNLTTLTITATAGTGTITDYGNGWYRVTASTSSAIANEVARYQFPNADGEYMYFWGAMAENGAYATSYIPTLAASVTRGANVVQKTSISSLIGQTEGVLFLDYTATQVASLNSEFSISAGTNATAIRLRQSSGNFLQGVVQNAGATQVSILTSFTIVIGQRYKIAFAYANNDFAMYVNGQLIGIDGSGSVPACSQIQNTSGGTSSTADFAGAVNQAILFKTRLPNSELASLTTL